MQSRQSLNWKLRQVAGCSLRAVLRAFLILCPVLVTVSAQERGGSNSGQGGDGATRGRSYSVSYTGRMMGYFRAPDQQDRSLGGVGGCPALEQPAQSFKELIDGFHSQLLVSMGDTFAPQLRARTLVVNQKFQIGKDLYTWDFLHEPHGWIEDRDLEKKEYTDLNAALEAGVGQIEIDNVACFLFSAGFDALVPGKHDFYFGPERLRQLSRLLSAQGVEMLSANLAIASTQVDAAPRVPDNQKKRRGFERQSMDIKIDLPEVILPSLRQFPIAGTTAETQAFVCKSDRYDGKYSDPDEIELPPRNEGPLRCMRLDRLGPANTSEKVRFGFHSSSDKLEQDRNYHLCTYPSEKAIQEGPEPYCLAFSVHSPFFQYQHLQIGGGNLPTPGNYKLKKIGTEKDPYWVAVFGVVDPELLGLVGSLNDSWVNTKGGKEQKRYATRIEAFDPASALTQVLQECSEDPRCASARKVLLAQMERSKAEQLAAELRGRFDLVIADTDPEVYTEKERVDRSTEKADAAPLPFVAVPRPHGADGPNDPAGEIDIRLSRATVTLPPGCTRESCPGERVLDNYVETKRASLPTSRFFYRPTAAPASGAALTLLDLLKDFVRRKTNHYREPDDKDGTTLVAQAALLAMRERYQTDLALMQKRDAWDPENKAKLPVTPASLQELLDIIFWKGDFVFREPITGATLKSIVEQSKKWEAQEKNALNTDPETMRELIPLGMFQDANTKSLIVNGIPVEDGKLYGVAMTDYLAFGDTGYADLQKPAVPPGDRVSGKMLLVSLSGLLCKAIQDTVEGFHKADCHSRPVSGKDYLDDLASRPFDSTPGITPVRHVIDWATFRRTQNIFKSLKGRELAAEQRRLFSLTLDKVDFGYTLNEHNNGTEAQLTSKFAGVPVAPVTSADAITLTTDYSFRAAMSTRYYDLFSQNDMAYSQQSQRAGNNAYVRSQKANILGTELGVGWRIYPRRRQVSNLKVLSSLRMETQTARPLTNFALADGTKLIGPTDRTERFYGKLGLRYEDAKSWAEFGFEPGRNFNTPIAYTFNPASANPITCLAVAGKAPSASNAEANTSLSDCVSYWSRVTDAAGNQSPQVITSGSAFQPLTKDRWERGVFANFKASVPLPFNSMGKPTFYVMQGKSDWFFSRSDDVSLDTKYFIDWTHSLVVPLFGNLSIVPKVEVFFYENKVAGNTFHAIQTTLTFQYTFDWHEGLGFWKSLKYPNPAPGLGSGK